MTDCKCNDPITIPYWLLAKLVEGQSTDDSKWLAKQLRAHPANLDDKTIASLLPSIAEKQERHQRKMKAMRDAKAILKLTVGAVIFVEPLPPPKRFPGTRFVGLVKPEPESATPCYYKVAFLKKDTKEIALNFFGNTLDGVVTDGRQKRLRPRVWIKADELLDRIKNNEQAYENWKKRDKGIRLYD